MKIQWHTELSGNPAKPAVLFLHGFMGSGADWAHCCRALSKSHHCMCPDLPGHGRTTVLNGPPEGYTMDKVANGLLAHLDACGIDSAAIVGYSMGGRLALRLALECPERFPVAVIESASPGLRSEQEQDARREYDFGLARELETIGHDNLLFHAFLEKWYEQPIFNTLRRDKARLRDLVAARLRHNKPPELAAALRGMSTGVQECLWDRLPGLSTPTLLVVGEEDHKYKIIAEEMADRCDAMAVEVLAGCGHNVHLENPEGYTGLLRHFLDRLQ